VCYESNGGPDTPDLLHKGKRGMYGGVHCFDLRTRVAWYPGSFWVQHLKEPLTPEAEAKLVACARRHHEARTRYDAKQTTAAALDFADWVDLPLLTTKTKESTTALFCSELVALCLREAGVIPATVNVSEVMPAECGAFPCFGPVHVLKQFNHRTHKVRGVSAAAAHTTHPARALAARRAPPPRDVLPRFRPRVLPPPAT
jgi:hypothetical protein